MLLGCSPETADTIGIHIYCLIGNMPSRHFHAYAEA